MKLVDDRWTEIEAEPAVLSEPSRRRHHERDRARSRHFVRGPVPMPWLERAARLPGKTLAVGLLLWFGWGMSKPKPVRLTHGLLARFGIDRKAGYRALKAMEDAGLIAVDRKPGRCPVVTVITGKNTINGV